MKVLFVWAIFMVILSFAYVASIVYRALKRHEKTYMQMRIPVFASAALLIIWIVALWVWDNIFVSIAFIAVYVLSFISTFIDLKEYESNRQKLPENAGIHITETTESEETK